MMRRPRLKARGVMILLSYLLVLSLKRISKFQIISVHSSMHLWQTNDAALKLFVPETPDPVPMEKVTDAISNTSDTDPLASCPVTSQVRLVMQPQRNWILQSLDIKGNRKTVGGDEYYITYTDTTNNTPYPTAVAMVEDLSDGTYELDFVTTPFYSIPHNLTGEGTLTIHFEFSCGIGQMAPPTKDNWKNGGYTQTTYVHYNVSAPLMRNFERPNRNHEVDFGQHGMVVAVGDSVMDQFTQSRRIAGGNAYISGNIGRPLNSNTVQAFVERAQRDLSRFPDKDNLGLILGSSVWDVLADDFHQGQDFSDHRDACRKLITSLRQEYAHVTIYWKSPTAAHTHVLAQTSRYFPNLQKLIMRIRYMSASRTRDLYQFQKEIMEELNVPFLDMWQATYLSAAWLMPKDSRHYGPELNELMINWFYRDTTNDGSLERKEEHAENK